MTMHVLHALIAYCLKTSKRLVVVVTTSPTLQKMRFDFVAVVGMDIGLSVVVVVVVVVAVLNTNDHN
jgi:hypothetical protein